MCQKMRLSLRLNVSLAIHLFLHPCSSLGHFWIPGHSCGISTPVVRPRALTAGSAFECVFAATAAERKLFFQRCSELWLRGCRQTMKPVRLEDKSGWDAFANDVFGNDAVWGAHLAIDGIVTPDGSSPSPFFLQNQLRGDGWLQVSLDQAYHVSSVLVEVRRGCCPGRNSHLEVRVGNTDTKALSRGRLRVNEVCAVGDDSFAETMEYSCARPLRGRHVTLQKVALSDSDNFSFSVNELEVFVVQL